MSRYAAIDIGTVTCRMIVADVDDEGIRPSITTLTKEYAITNLGEEVDATNRLKPEAMERVTEAVARYVDIRESLNTPEDPIISTMTVATSAARDAENAAEFVTKLTELGVSLDVIPGEKEAALSFMGACSGQPNTDDLFMVVDVGGGSTEITIGYAGGDPLRSHSFDIGCRRLTERYLVSDPPTPDEMEQAAQMIRTLLKPWFAEGDRELFSEEGGATQKPRMIAVAGTATTAVSIRDAMEVYDSDLVDGSIVTREDIRQLSRMLSSLPLEERRRVVGLDPGRAPVIVAGMIILGEVMDAAGVTAFTVSESDILEGMLLYLIGQGRVISS